MSRSSKLKGSDKMKLKLSYIFTVLFAALMAVVTPSCVYDKYIDLDENQPILPPGAEKGLSLNFTVTLDNMGGSALLGNNPMQEIENYIDPEKFRVLFFDEDEYFLFESMSRWVKKLGSTDDYTNWFVSVPFYSSGNDTGDYDWDWDYIRQKLTSGSFKIAILANRPAVEYLPNMDNVPGINPVNYFNNGGPYWTKDDGGKNRKKRIIDLHHCQWDPIYTSKGLRYSGGTAESNITSEGYYDFIAGIDPKATRYQDKIMMGATSSWATFNAADNIKDGYDKRFARMPSKEYPIPMYGIQEFDKIENWIEGTPFNLSDVTQGSLEGYEHKSISLLRSVVRIELLVPKVAGTKTIKQPQYVGLKYTNVYARCEPMDVWTPTDKIWEKDHDDCEEKYIMNYGLMTKKGDYFGEKGSNNDSWKQFRERLSWFYGVWKEPYRDGTPRWTFGNYGINNVVKENPGVTTYPRVYNPCTQRNGTVRISDKASLNENVALFSHPSYYHYIVYVGERNMNDPSDLFNMSGKGKSTDVDPAGGKVPTISWIVEINGTVYSIPIAKNGYKYIGSDTYSASTMPSDRLNDKFSNQIYNNPTVSADYPWPLIRNHVYRMTLGVTGTTSPQYPIATTSRSDNQPMVVTSVVENLSSPTIRFK